MKRSAVTGSLLLAAGTGIGAGISHFPVASAASKPSPTPLAQQKFPGSIDEVNPNLVFGHEFSGQYRMTVTLSDGSKRHIQRTPMRHNGMQVVELKDNDGHTYRGLNGTTTNGKLMAQVRDLATMKKNQGRGLARRRFRFDSLTATTTSGFHASVIRGEPDTASAQESSPTRTDSFELVISRKLGSRSRWWSGKDRWHWILHSRK